mmetsp:Transcript_47349/g.94749  ORF Transcript_47349/g.94749 Transcript_47349/m.94749 type:complete len:122 (+) Transcript_47349:94-459(+)
MRVLVATVVQNSTKRKNLQIRQRGAALSMVSRAEAQRFAVYEVEYLIIPAATACSADCAFFSTGTWISTLPALIVALIALFWIKWLSSTLTTLKLNRRRDDDCLRNLQHAVKFALNRVETA